MLILKVTKVTTENQKSWPALRAISSSKGCTTKTRPAETLKWSKSYEAETSLVT